MSWNRYQLTFLLLLSILSVATVFTSDFKTDISAFFIAGDNAEEILLASEIQSGALSRRTILSLGSIEKTRIPQSLINEFTAKLRNIPGVVDVWKAGETRDFIKSIEQLYLPYGPTLYSRNPEQELPKMLNTQGLAERASGLKNALLSPQSALIKKVAKVDPLLLIFNGFKNIQPFQSNQKSHSLHTNLLLETEMSGMNVSAQSQIQQRIKSEFAQLTEKFNADGRTYQLEMTGVPIFAAATQGMMESDIAFISTLSSIALAVLFFWIFRSFSLFFWVSCLLLVVISTTILVINFLFGYVHAMTIAIGSTLVGVCVDYPIHALVHAQSPEIAARKIAIAKIWPSMLIGGITTSIGYVAVGLSGYPGFQQVAVYAGTGIFTSLLLTRYVLPYLITGKKSSSRFPLALQWIKFCNRYRTGLLVAVLMLSGISLFTLNSLQWLQDLQQLTPELDDLKMKDQEIRSRMISIEPGRFVLVTGKDTESTLQNAENVYNILDNLKQQKSLSDYFGLYPWLLSEKQQQLNAQLLQLQLTDEVKQSWQKALAKENLSVEQLGQINLAPKAPLQVQQVLQSPVGRLLSNQIIINGKQTLIIIWLGEHQPEILQKTLEGMPQVYYFSQRDLLNKMAISYQKRAESMFLVGFALIVGILSIRYRNIPKALLTLVPAMLSTTIILAIWALAGQPLSFLHLIGFLLVISICDDFTIFYQENPGNDIAITYQAIAASMLTSALGFGCLIVAQTSILRTLAEIVTGGVILGFLLCPIIIKQSNLNDGHL